MKWFIRNSRGETTEIEGRSRSEAITKYLESPPEFLGLFLEVFTKGTHKYEIISHFVPRELLERHLIPNADFVKIMNDMGWDAALDDKWYKLLKDNARFFKQMEKSGGEF